MRNVILLMALLAVPALAESDLDEAPILGGRLTLCAAPSQALVTAQTLSSAGYRITSCYWQFLPPQVCFSSRFVGPSVAGEIIQSIDPTDAVLDALEAAGYREQCASGVATVQTLPFVSEGSEGLKGAGFEHRHYLLRRDPLGPVTTF